MIVIYAEKQSLAAQIAVALDKITLESGKEVTYATLSANSKAVEDLQKKNLVLPITYMGKEYSIIWGSGHLCALKREKDYNPDYQKWENLPIPFFPDMSLKVNDSGNEYAVKKAKALVKNARHFFSKAEYIINAADDDREGELLFTYLYEYLNCRKPVKRVLLSSYTKGGFRKSFDDLIDGADREPVIAAGKARSHSDFIIGTNITTLLTLHNPGCGIISAGRVQTTVLNMIVERELAIKGFSSQKYYTVEGEFKTSTGETYVGTHEQQKFTEKEKADEAVKACGKEGSVIEITTEVKKKDAPQLYNLAALQVDANVLYGFTIEKTLNIAQKLYEDAFTTYARTKSRYLNEDKQEEIKKLLDILETFSPEYEKALKGRPRVFNVKKYFDDSKVSSHFAIIPTGKKPVGLSPDEQKIYTLIANSIVNMLSEDAEILHTKIVTVTNGERFVSSGSTVIKEGWMEISGKPREKELPKLVKGEQVSVLNVQAVERDTKPPKRFTDASLVQAMIHAGRNLDDKELRELMSDPNTGGIGTDATRSAIVNTLLERGYIERNKNKFAATPKGIELIRLIPIDELKSVETTARWDKRLNEIEAGKDTYEDFIRDVKQDVIKWCDAIRKSDSMSHDETMEKVGNCPVCGKSVVKQKWGYGCTGYKDGCKFSVGTICGKKISDAQVKMLLEKGKTGIIKGFVGKTSGKTFDAALKVEEGKVCFEFAKSDSESDQEVIGVCPFCGKNIVTKSWGYSCTGYKDGCQFSVGTICGKTISKTHIKALITNGKTPVISGFKGKSGKKFNAALKLEDGSVKFDFD